MAVAIVTGMFGLPDHIRACLFDLDGVPTPTAKVHAAAWKELFDEVLSQDAERTGRPFVPFDLIDDYQQYVDGKARVDGARSCITARDIGLPEGRPGAPPAARTVEGTPAAFAERLPGMPATDTFLAAAARFGIAPHETAVFEDALAGVGAGRVGGFGFVAGVARDGAAGELLARGADVVVNDLEELLGR